MSRLFLLLVFFMTLSNAYANTTPVHTYTLPNGLQLFVQEDHRAPVAISQIWYKVGSSYEPNGITGISHVLEHMMFKGTQKYPNGEFSRIISENGGQENAMTSDDYTVYYQLISADKLPISFELEADRMRHLTLDPSEFAKEIQVVMEERRMRYEDNPQSLAYERFRAAAYVSSPYHHLPIGWMSDLQQMTVQDVRQWYQQWYAPNNAFIVVVGDVKPDEVHQLALKHFGGIPSITLPEIKKHPEIPTLGKREVTVKLPAQLPWLIMGYSVPHIKMTENSQNQDAYALAVVSAILSGGDNSWLNRHLIRGKQIATSASASYDPFTRLSSLFMLEATPAPDHDISAVKQALLQEIHQLQETLVDEKELERIKVGLLADKTYGKDSISNQALEIGGLQAVGLPWQLRDELIKKIAQVTPKDVQSVARRYLTEDNLTLTELKPLPIHANQKTPQPAQSPLEANKSIQDSPHKVTPPSSLSMSPNKVPTLSTSLESGSFKKSIQQWNTNQDIPVYFIQTPGLPMLDVQVIFSAGSAHDGEKWGLAQFTNALLNEGAGKLSADEIAETFDSVGAIFEAHVGQDMASIGLRSMSSPKYLDKALSTFVTVLSEPQFNLDAVTRVRKQLLSVIDMESQEPRVIAKKAFLEALYGKHPYAHPVNGSTASIQEITQHDIQRFYQQHYITSNAMIALVGDITTEQAKNISQQISTHIHSGKKTPAIPLVTELKTASQPSIRFPSQQTTIILGQLGMTPQSKDYFPLMVGNYILGGDFISRLFQKIRNENGLVYQVSSRLAPLQATGPFLIFLQTRHAEANKALTMTKEILEKFIETGPTATELSNAKKHLIGSFPLGLASNSDLLYQLNYIGFYHLPLNWLDHWRDQVNQLTTEQIQQAFSRLLHHKPLVVTTVGE